MAARKKVALAVEPKLPRVYDRNMVAKPLTMEAIVAEGACGDGKRWFAKNAEGGKINDAFVIKMVNEHPDYYKWCLEHGFEEAARLPDNLSVGGYLYLSGTAITSLPDNLSVGGYLYLSGTAIKRKDVPAKLKSKVIL